MIKNSYIYKSDCKYFRGDIPCKPHKNEGYHCEDCPVYSVPDIKILIIKLGAIGDVIRTTPLLTRIMKEYKNPEIWWLTYSPEIVPQCVDKVLKFSTESILTLQGNKFDLLINLDKDYYACSLASSVEAIRKQGFIMLDGKPAPADEKAEAKFITGLFDDANKANDLNYLQEIFSICGWEYSGEEYILEFDKSIKWNIYNDHKKIVGLNTGCGARWVSRLWDNANWVALIKSLQDHGYYPLLLGGEQEHSNNMLLSEQTGAEYLGYFNLRKFISLMNQCDLIVSAVTMGMHLAIGLKKPLILMNNIFNPKEFELFGRGEIVQPEKECKCFFSPKCKNPDYFCMDSLKPATLLEAIQRYI